MCVFSIAFAYCQAQSDTTVLSSTVRYNGAVKHSQIQRYCQAQSDTTVLSRDDAVLFKEGAECITGCRKASAKGRRER